MNLLDILAQATLATRRAKRIEYTLGTDLFRSLFESASEEDKESLKPIVESCSELELKDWIQRVRGKQYDKMSARELRRLGSARKIQDYHLLRKEELIDELRHQDRLAGCCETPFGDEGDGTSSTV